MLQLGHAMSMPETSIQPQSTKMAPSGTKVPLIFVFFLIATTVQGLPKIEKTPSTRILENHQNLSASTTIFFTDNIAGPERSTASTLDLSKVSRTVNSNDVENITPAVEKITPTVEKITPVVDKEHGNETHEESGIIDKLKTDSPLASKNKRTEYEELPVALPQTDSKNGYQRDDGTYVIEDSADTPCILAYFKAKLTIYYPTNRKQEKYTSAVVRPPDNVDISGTCDRDSVIATLDLTWEQGVFTLRFAFDDLTDSWYVDQFMFVFNTSMSAYSGVDKIESVTLKSIENKRFWTTSHARSFRCLLLHDVSLLEENDHYSATIHFDEARVQAFTKTENFKTPKHCIHRVHRDEMVPVTVGGVLAGITLLFLAAYGGFRYFKIKKFQYGTME